MIPVQAKIAAGVIFAIGLFAFGYKVAAWQYGATIADLRADYAQAAKQAADEALAKQRAEEKAAADAEAHAAELAALQAEKNRVHTKKVIQYVTKDPDAGSCRLPAGFVRVTDSAAANTMPSYTGAPVSGDDPAAGFTDADALPVIVGNYTACNEIKAQLVELQEWARVVSGR